MRDIDGGIISAVFLGPSHINSNCSHPTEALDTALVNHLQKPRFITTSTLYILGEMCIPIVNLNKSQLNCKMLTRFITNQYDYH